MKLKEAIDFVEEYENWRVEVNGRGTKPKSVNNAMNLLIQAAKDMQYMIEARKEATAGEWVVSGLTTAYYPIKTIEHGKPALVCRVDRKKYYKQDAPNCELRHKNIANFIVTAANILEKWSDRDE